MHSLAVLVLAQALSLPVLQAAVRKEVVVAAMVAELLLLCICATFRLCRSNLSYCNLRPHSRGRTYNVPFWRKMAFRMYVDEAKRDGHRLPVNSSRHAISQIKCHQGTAVVPAVVFDGPPLVG